MNINFKKPWIIGLAISLPFFLMATVSLIETAQMSKLICQRVESGQGRCELTRVDWLGKTSTKTWQTNEIKKIEFIDDRQQIRLLTPQGEIILMPFYESAGKGSNKWYKQSIVKRMEAFFLNNLEAEPNLMIEEDNRGVGYIHGIYLIFMGLICVMGGLDYSINMKKRIK
ncbi:hypothetical protein [Microcoleus sp. B3-D7]|uniref:hypothetical protein n=1 Tax=Microcoleus sp. B3-D7 TaxID=2818659 RepID=UPI002FD221F9